MEKNQGINKTVVSFLGKKVLFNLPVYFFLLTFLFTPFLHLLFNAHWQHIAAFGCFDECANYVSGYFMLKGRKLYEGVWYNHQMLMPHISYLIQKAFQPESIYKLLQYHRLFIFFFGIMIDLLLMYRLGWIGVGFTILFELTRFYFMGSFFIGESLIVYLLTYVFAVVFFALAGRPIKRLDSILVPIFCWMAIFLREPYVLVALFLFGVFCFLVKGIQRRIALSLFGVLTAGILFTTSLPDYFQQVFLLNFKDVFQAEVSSSKLMGVGILYVFFYPLFILFTGHWTLMREILIGIDVVFLVGSVLLLTKTSKKKLFLLVFITLGLANLRFVPPGKMYYEAFHSNVWYGLFIMATLAFLWVVFSVKQYRKLAYLLVILYIGVCAYAFFSPRAFHFDKIDRIGDYKFNFDKNYAFGEVVKKLAGPKDTLFVEHFDELIYWQSGLDSPARYPMAPQQPEYEASHIQMFRENPPTFYYYGCSGKQRTSPHLPAFIKNNYQQMYYAEGLSCFYILKEKMEQIPSSEWESLRSFRISPQPS